MTLYAEPSAVLSWWRGEPRGDDVRRAIERADAVATSELSFLEIERAVIRAVAVKQLTAADAARMRAMIERTTAGWTVAPITHDVWTAARATFPREPVRALDAIHLGTILVTRTWARDIAVLSLDDRVRENARLLGFTVVP